MTVIDAGALRAAVTKLLGVVTAALPREIRESLISKATLAILNASDAAHAELEVTAVLNEINEYLWGAK